MPRPLPMSLLPRSLLSTASPSVSQAGRATALTREERRGMAVNNVSLLQYLQHGIPPLVAVTPHPNTTNDAYSWRDIDSISPWVGFDLAHIQAGLYGALLTNVLVPNNVALPQSPPGPVTSEAVLQGRFSEYQLGRIRRALRATFAHMHANNILLNGRTPVTIDLGSSAEEINRFRPDLALYDPTQPLKTAVNRGPGEVKPSYQWATRLMTTGDVQDQREFCQALSQLNYYMKQHGTRYGFMCTDQELVAVHRLDANGNLELSAPIAWNAAGPGQLTIALAIWYIGMLVSDDNGYPRL